MFRSVLFNEPVNVFSPIRNHHTFSFFPHMCVFFIIIIISPFSFFYKLSHPLILLIFGRIMFSMYRNVSISSNCKSLKLINRTFPSCTFISKELVEVFRVKTHMSRLKNKTARLVSFRVKKNVSVDIFYWTSQYTMAMSLVLSCRTECSDGMLQRYC